MTTKKRIISFVLAVAMVLASVIIPAVPVKADETKSITLTGVKHDGYYAYQIFSGVVSGDDPDSVLGDIAWGDGVNKTTLATKLLADDTIKSYFTGLSTTDPSAEAVANALVEMNKKTNNDVLLNAFAACVAASKVDASKITGSHNEADSITVFENLAGGYYLLVDDADLSDEDDANSAYIIKVFNDLEMAIKMEVPTLEKKIIEETKKVTANVASIGDEVKYELVTTVPNMTGYNKYFYIVNDTLDDGLTYNNDSLKILFDGDELSDSDDYSLTVNGQKIEIVFKNFLENYAGKTGEEFTITYSATVNENAVIGGDGNKNTASVTFSNDPKVTYEGGDDPDKPGDGEPTGETPDKKVVTKVYGIKLTKVDGEDATKKLIGAKFQISSDNATFISKINENIFERDDTNGTYHRLKNGTYKTGDVDAKDCENEDASALYKLVENITYTTSSAKIMTDGYVIEEDGDDKGTITFKGLGAGTYKIQELIAPEGYNTLTGTIDVTINADYTNVDAPVFTYNDENGDPTPMPADGIIPINVKNNKGIVLPSTGGMGTTLFYVVGGALVLVAGVLLVTKKRMERE